MKLLEMGKDMNIKHSVFLSPTKYGGTFFAKNFAWGTKRLRANLWGGCFTWGLMIRSCKEAVNGLRGFKGRVKFSSH